MTISEKKMQIVIDNYFRSECDVKTSIRQAFEKGFRIGVKKGPSAEKTGEWIEDDETGELMCSICSSGKPTMAACSSVFEHKLSNHEIRFCYYCGAKMGG